MSKLKGCSDCSKSCERSALSRATPTHRGVLGCRCMLLEKYTEFPPLSCLGCFIRGIAESTHLPLRAVFLFTKQISPMAGSYTMTTRQLLRTQSDQEIYVLLRSLQYRYTVTFFPLSCYGNLLFGKQGPLHPSEKLLKESGLWGIVAGTTKGVDGQMTQFHSVKIHR